MSELLSLIALEKINIAFIYHQPQLDLSKLELEFATRGFTKVKKFTSFDIK